MLQAWQRALIQQGHASMNDSALAGLGLTGGEAASRLAQDGFNELPSAKPRSFCSIAWEVVREPMFLLLVSAYTI